MSSKEAKVFYRFSKDCNQFVVAHSDNKAAVWNCLNGTEEKVVLQKSFLNSQIDSLDISKRKGTSVVALASSTGKVLLYNLKTQEITQLPKEHSGGILDLKFNEDGTNVYSLSEDKKIYKYDVALKEVVYEKELKRKNLLESGLLAPIKNNLLLFAYENKLVLLDTETDKEERKFKGHSKNISIVSVAENGTHFASFSEEGFINFYNLKKSNPVHSVSVLSKSRLLSLLLLNITKHQFLAIALHHDAVEIWQFTLTPNQDNGVVITQTSNNSFKIPSTNVLSLSSITLQTDQNASSTISIWAALGDNIGMEFGNVRAVQNGKFEFQEFKKSLLNLSAAKEHKTPKISKQIEQVDREKGAYIPDEKDLAVVQDLNSLEIEDKEEILEIVKKVDAIKLPDIGTVQSLSVVLQQALQNNDTQLIDFCLEKENEDMIDQTVRNMQSVKVLILLDKLHERLNSLPYKAANLGKWLKASLKYHSTILITSPSAQLKLQPFATLIESRTKNINKLIGLRGKIDMVLALRKQQALNSAGADQESLSKPLVIYEEGDASIEVESEVKVLKKTKLPRKEEDFSDSVSDSESEISEEDEEEYEEVEAKPKKVKQVSEDERSESDADEDFDMAAQQHVKERVEKYKNINFDDDESAEMEQEDSDFIEM